MKKHNQVVLHEGETREIIIYRDGSNAPKVEVLLRIENLWVTQKAMSALFDIECSVITKHIKNTFETGEQSENQVCAKIAHTAGKTTTQIKYMIFYNNK
ncbi:MAG: hypothetical protein FWH18_00230 [Marinilabiliaceae bacterium]|nr:hypothetical protein [Marinilabiliaceae bacterium]